MISQFPKVSKWKMINCVAKKNEDDKVRHFQNFGWRKLNFSPKKNHKSFISRKLEKMETKVNIFPNLNVPSSSFGRFCVCVCQLGWACVYWLSMHTRSLGPKRAPDFGYFLFVLSGLDDGNQTHSPRQSIINKLILTTGFRFWNASSSSFCCLCSIGFNGRLPACSSPFCVNTQFHCVHQWLIKLNNRSRRPRWSVNRSRVVVVLGWIITTELCVRIN